MVRILSKFSVKCMWEFIGEARIFFCGDCLWRSTKFMYNRSNVDPKKTRSKNSSKDLRRNISCDLSTNVFGILPFCFLQEFLYKFLQSFLWNSHGKSLIWLYFDMFSADIGPSDPTRFFFGEFLSNCLKTFLK